MFFNDIWLKVKIYFIALVVNSHPEPSIMEFQLTSAFSTRVSWEPVEGSGAYSLQWRQGDVVKETKCEDTNLLLLNLEPNTSYDVRVAAVTDNKEDIFGSFKTFPESEPHLNNLYESVKLSDGTYDATQFEKKAHDVFLKYFNDVVKNGDTIYTSVVLKGASKNIQTQAVVEGSTVSVSGDENLFLPFTTDSTHENQIVTLENKVTQKQSADDENAYAPKVQLTYTPSSDSFVLGDRVFKVGDRFELFGKAVTVADGSIVLVFEDTVQLVYPFAIGSASNVTTSAGSQFVKNSTVNTINIIGTRTTGNAGSTRQSGWLYDSVADTISEATRIVHTIDDNGETGGMSIGTLHTDAGGNAFIEPSLQLAPTSTTISVQNASDQTVSATFNETGLSFDSSEASIYFGSSQEFRIIFNNGVLSIQSYDSDSASYVSRADFSDGS